MLENSTTSMTSLIIMRPQSFTPETKAIPSRWRQGAKAVEVVGRFLLDRRCVLGNTLRKSFDCVCSDTRRKVTYLPSISGNLAARLTTGRLFIPMRMKVGATEGRCFPTAICCNLSCRRAAEKCR